MLALAAALGLVMGVVIGGLGGGGGVLTVPALVYVLGQGAQAATTSSVIIVGIAAAVGAVARIRGAGVDWRNGIALGVVGIPAAYWGTLLNRHVGQPVLLLAFAGLTVVAAVAMLLNARGSDELPEAEESDRSNSGARTRSALVTLSRTDRSQLVLTVLKVIACGAAVGFLTGFLGVGGGFLVIPVLVIAFRMPMALAIGTSLLVIVLNSISSVVSRFGEMHLDWRVIAPFTIAAVVGTLIGKRVADKLSGAALTRSFAVMLLAVGIFVAVESLVAL
jgi:uncharacterized membrane protein YfcA